MGDPTERGAQQAATREAFDLVGKTYYHPYSGGRDLAKRNAGVPNNPDPIVMHNYTFNISDRSNLELARARRYLANGYSAVTWHKCPDSRHNYYRYVPCYFALDANYLGAVWH